MTSKVVPQGNDNFGNNLPKITPSKTRKPSFKLSQFQILEVLSSFGLYRDFFSSFLLYFPPPLPFTWPSQSRSDLFNSSLTLKANRHILWEWYFELKMVWFDPPSAPRCLSHKHYDVSWQNLWSKKITQLFYYFSHWVGFIVFKTSPRFFVYVLWLNFWQEQKENRNIVNWKQNFGHCFQFQPYSLIYISPVQANTPIFTLVSNIKSRDGDSEFLLFLFISTYIFLLKLW